jgi:tight adherence protein B
VVLLLDTSGSMREGGAIDAAKLSAAGFLAELPSDVPVGMVAFNDTPSLASPLTLDRQASLNALGSLTATGETALYDAIVFSRSLFSGGTTDQQIVLLSDGGDTVSLAGLDDAIEITSGIRTSAIELESSEANQEALEQLAAAGNGQLTSISDPTALATLYRDVASSLVNRYRLAFTTEATGPTQYTVEVDTLNGLLTTSTETSLPASPTTDAVTATTEVAEVVEPTTDTPEPTSAVGEVAAETPRSTDPQDDSRLLLFGGSGAVFVALTALILLAWPTDRAVLAGRRQLGVTGVRSSEGDARPSVSDRLSTLADRALERGDRRSGLANALDVAAISLRPGEFAVIIVAVAVTTALVLLLLIGPIGAIVGAVGTVIGARLYVNRRAEKRRRAFGEQLPDVLQLLSSSLRAGYALPQAMDAVAHQAAEPARSEFQRVMFESRVGRDLVESLAATATRMRSKDFDWVVASFDINREVGGELAQVLDSVAATVRERQELRRQVRILTAEGRTSAYVLTALPIGLVAILLLINPEYFEPMTEPPGPALIGFCVLLMVVGWAWTRRIIRDQT